MSLLPFIFNDYPTSHHRFGAGFHPQDLWISPVERTLLRSLSNTGNYLRPELSNFDEIEKKTHIGKDGFQVSLDVQHFQPNEISVLTENNCIVVTAKHEEKKDDHGYISREFKRRYDLPKGFKVDHVTSSLSSDGVLTLKCPCRAIEDCNVRHIQIQQTGPVKLSIKKPEEQKNPE